MQKYSVSIIWSDEERCYVATVPEFPGLSAFGDTQEEAIHEAQSALKGFIKVYKKDGCPLPKPNKFIPYSGQTRVRLPKSLHASLSEEAKRDGVSLNTYIVKILSERHKEQEIATLTRKVESLEKYVYLKIMEEKQITLAALSSADQNIVAFSGPSEGLCESWEKLEPNETDQSSNFKIFFSSCLSIPNDPLRNLKNG